MCVRSVALSEAIDLIDSPAAEPVLVLLADAGGPAALRCAMRQRPSKRAISWLVARSNEGPDDFARRLVAALKGADFAGLDEDARALLDRALDSFAGSQVRCSLLIEEAGRITDPRVESMIGYLVEFLPPELRVVFVGAPPRAGLPRLLVRARARVFSLVTGST